MRLLDANILMYASFDAFPQHVRTKKWLDARLNDSNTPLGIPWESILAFVLGMTGVSAVIIGSGPGQGYRADWIDCGKNRGSLRMPRGDSLDGPDTRSLEFSGDDSACEKVCCRDGLPNRGRASFAGQ